VIASLHSVGVKITYDALMKRVSRALIEKNITKIRLTNTSEKRQWCPPYHLTDKPTIHSPLRTHPKKPHTSINHTKLPNSNLVLEVGPKEAPRQKRSKTRKMNINVLIPLFWNTPSNTTPLNLLKERWNMGT
jgi:hypothetical protein